MGAMTLTAAIRKMWEHERAVLIHDWLVEGRMTRKQIAKRLNLKDKSLQGILGELNAHYYIFVWRSGNDVYYELQKNEFLPCGHSTRSVHGTVTKWC